MKKIILILGALTLVSGCVVRTNHPHHDRVYVDEPVIVEDPQYHHHHDRVYVEESPRVVEVR